MGRDLYLYKQALLSALDYPFVYAVFQGAPVGVADGKEYAAHQLAIIAADMPYGVPNQLEA